MIWALRRGTLAGERSIIEMNGGFRVIATNYDRTFNLGPLARSLPIQVPLFALDAGFNAYFQYQAESDLPSDLRFWRSVAGGAGNAGVSSIVAGVGGVALGAMSCPETFGAGCVIAVAAILGGDLLANHLFDSYAKEPVLEVFGLGRE